MKAVLAALLIAISTPSHAASRADCEAAINGYGQMTDRVRILTRFYSDVLALARDMLANDTDEARGVALADLLTLTSDELAPLTRNSPAPGLAALIRMCGG